MSEKVGPTSPGWVRLDRHIMAWFNQDAPGYQIWYVGTGYEVYMENRRVGSKVPKFEDAVKVVETDMKDAHEPATQTFSSDNLSPVLAELDLYIPGLSYQETADKIN